MTNEEIKQTVAEINVRNHNSGPLASEYGQQANADRATLLEITAHLQKTIEAQAEEIKALQTENNGRALAMDVLKSEYDKQAEEIRIMKERNKLSNQVIALADFYGVRAFDGAGESIRYSELRAVLSAFDSTRDKEQT